MAHFAQLDENNIVQKVIVVSNENISDVNGIESEELGVAFCKKLYGLDTKWVQTSYNGNFRGRYAGIGAYYDEERDLFSNTQEYPSWVFDEELLLWVAPIPVPEELEPKPYRFHVWDEELHQEDNTKGWVLRDYQTEMEAIPNPPNPLELVPEIYRQNIAESTLQNITEPDQE